MPVKKPVKNVAPRFDANGVELTRCTACKCWWWAIADFALDRHGLRRKTCIHCKAKRQAKKTILLTDADIDELLSI